MRGALLLTSLLPFVTAAAAEEGVLTFEKISKYDRIAEPVAFGIPFPKGLLRDASQFGLFDGSRAVPVQASVARRWPDGTIRWMFVRTFVDLPGNRGKQISWRTGGAPPALTRDLVRKLGDNSIEIDTGPLKARIPADGFFPLVDVRLNGKPIWQRTSGFTFRIGNRNFSTADAGPVKIEVKESGPLAAVVRVSGRHGPADTPFDFSAELTFWAGKSYATLDYRVLLARGPNETLVDSWDWSALSPGGNARLRTGHGHYTSTIKESATPLSFTFGPTEFRFHSVEHAFQSYWGDFWADWTNGDAGLAVTLRQAQQNFPKAMDVTPDRITLALYPAQKEPLWFPLGAAKTHQMMLNFHLADLPAAEISARSLQYQIPDIPQFEASWFERCGVWDDRVFGAPASRRIDALVYDILDNRPVGTGIWNFGDEVDWGYTGQGRGRDDVVWLNNEYDFAHHLFLQYARTGERRFLDYAFANARHWRDVDIAHVSPREDMRGGHIALQRRALAPVGGRSDRRVSLFRGRGCLERGAGNRRQHSAVSSPASISRPGAVQHPRIGMGHASHAGLVSRNGRPQVSGRLPAHRRRVQALAPGLPRPDRALYRSQPGTRPVHEEPHPGFAGALLPLRAR
ncbi:MAG: hypothetical protein ACKV22_03235 [Bryobacteraceae bacterium]